MAKFDQDAVDEAIKVLQPHIDVLFAEVSALSAKIDALGIGQLSLPISISQVFEDGTEVKYTKE